MVPNIFIEIKIKRKIINSIRFTVIAYCSCTTVTHCENLIPRQKIDSSPLVLANAAFYHEKILSGLSKFSFTDLNHELVTQFSKTYFPAVLIIIYYYTIINCNYCLYTTLYNAVNIVQSHLNNIIIGKTALCVSYYITVL